MARKDAKIAGILGTGWQAQAQLEAIAVVRKLEAVAVYGRDARRESFAREMSDRLNIPVRPVATSAEAVRGAEIICAATTSSYPVLFGADVAKGAHINAIGANHLRKRELDDAAVLRADVVVVDSIEQSRQEAGELVL